MFDFAKELVLTHAEILTGKTLRQEDEGFTSEDLETRLAEMKEEERL